MSLQPCKANRILYTYYTLVASQIESYPLKIQVQTTRNRCSLISNLISKDQTNLVFHGVYGNAEFKGDIVFAVRVSFLPLFHTTGWH